MRTTNSHNISKKQQWSNISVDNNQEHTTPVKQVNQIKNLIQSHSMQVNTSAHKLVAQ